MKESRKNRKRIEINNERKKLVMQQTKKERMKEMKL